MNAPPPEERRKISRWKKPRHAIFLLPNAFTTAALFAGFFAILASTRGEWQQAAVAVFIAALLDACDGRIARWTGTESSFGAEYDSLSDVIAFGVAPALIAYQWTLAELDKLGIGVAFGYCAATAMRLARFNSQSGGGDKRFFIGIPSPAAAVLAVAFIASMDAWHIPNDIPLTAIMTAIVYTAIALTMVSGFRYYSFKDFNIRRQRVPFRYVALFFVAAAGFYALTDTVMEVLLTALTLYLFSGYFYGFRKLFSRPAESSNKDGE